MDLLLERKAGVSEKLFYLINKMGHTHFTVTCGIDGDLDMTRFYQAVEDTVAGNEILRCYVDTYNDEIYVKKFKNVEVLPLDMIILDNDDEWINQINKLNNTTFENNIPFWRIVLLKSKNRIQIILNFHHSLFDAHSGIIVLAKILEQYANKESDKSVMAPAVESFLSNKISTAFKFGAKNFIKSLFQSYKAIQAQDIISIENRQGRFIPFYLDAELSEKVFSYCKEHELKVHSFFSTLYLMLASTRTDSNELICMSPVQLRTHLSQLKANELGLYVSAIYTRIKREENQEFLTRAKIFQEEFSQGLKNQEMLTSLMAQKIVLGPINSPKKLLALNEKWGSFSTSVTNLGRLDLKLQYGDLRIDHVSFIPSSAALGGSSFGGAIATFDDRILINHIYTMPAITEGKARELDKLFQFHLYKVLGMEPND